MQSTCTGGGYGISVTKQYFTRLARTIAGLFRRLQRHWAQIGFVKEIVKVREPVNTQPRSCTVCLRGTLLKFDNVSNAREYSVCIYSQIDQMSRSVTSGKIKGYPGSVARLCFVYRFMQTVERPGLIRICLHCNFIKEIIDVKVINVCYVIKICNLLTVTLTKKDK